MFPSVKTLLRQSVGHSCLLLYSAKGPFQLGTLRYIFMHTPGEIWFCHAKNSFYLLLPRLLEEMRIATTLGVLPQSAIIGRVEFTMQISAHCLSHRV